MKSPQMIEPRRAVPAPLVMTNRVVWFALLFGQLAFSAVIVVMKQQGSLHPSGLAINLMLPIGLALLIGVVLSSFVLPGWILDANAKEQQLRSRYTLANIIPMAMLEGVSLYGLVLVFLSANWLPAGIIPAVSILFQLFRFPRSVV